MLASLNLKSESESDAACLWDFATRLAVGEHMIGEGDGMFLSTSGVSLARRVALVPRAAGVAWEH